MSAAAVCRGSWPSLGLLLLGLLFLPAVIAFTSASPEEGDADADLHCVCVKTISSGIHPKHITTLEVIKAGRHCAVPQLIYKKYMKNSNSMINAKSKLFNPMKHDEVSQLKQKTSATLLINAMAPVTRPLLRAALLLLLLLLATSHQATGSIVATELRCQCLKTLPRIDFEDIQSLKVTPPGPHCTQTEVIATLKDGQEVCLDPEGPRLQKIIQKILKKSVWLIPEDIYCSREEVIGESRRGEKTPRAAGRYKRHSSSANFTIQTRVKLQTDMAAVGWLAFLLVVLSLGIFVDEEAGELFFILPHSFSHSGAVYTMYQLVRSRYKLCVCAIDDSVNELEALNLDSSDDSESSGDEVLDIGETAQLGEKERYYLDDHIQSSKKPRRRQLQTALLQVAHSAPPPYEKGICACATLLHSADDHREAQRSWALTGVYKLSKPFPLQDALVMVWDSKLQKGGSIAHEATMKYPIHCFSPHELKGLKGNESLTSGSETTSCGLDGANLGDYEVGMSGDSSRTTPEAGIVL
ncbi:chemokine (C-X-C motif) ligand 3 [Cricetulus griseus]